MNSRDDEIDEARRVRELEGEAKYGPINPRVDSRCFLKEARDELLDALNYAQWGKEKGELSLCDWVLIDRNIRFAIVLLDKARPVIS